MTQHEGREPALLYLSYDGMMEPLGQSQVLAYLERLAADYSIHLVSFEKYLDWQNAQQRQVVANRIRDAGIYWHPRRYHKRPSALATAWDILVGIVTGLTLTVRYRIRIIHARSYVPAAMALMIKRMTGVKFLFDMRGFWADLRADDGLAPRAGMTYRTVKWLECRFLLGADYIVSLTHAAVREMQQFDYLRGRHMEVAVIPTCTDLKRFRRLPHSCERGLVCGYVGTAQSGWYRFDVTAACFRELLTLRANTRFLVINRNEQDYIRAQLDAAGIQNGLLYEIRAASHADMPFHVAQMDAAIFFIEPRFSVQAMAPTKLGEFLGCGIPCLSNSGVGDMAEILEGERVGVAVDAFDPASLQVGLHRLLALLEEPDIRERCVATAHKYFSLDEGVQRYAAVYRSLLSES